MADKIYVGDIGTEILVDCAADISTASNPVIEVKKPDGTVVQWPATLQGTTTLRYVTQAGDLDQEGRYLVQARPNILGWSGRGETARFVVRPAFA